MRIIKIKSGCLKWQPVIKKEIKMIKLKDMIIRNLVEEKGYQVKDLKLSEAELEDKYVQEFGQLKLDCLKMAVNGLKAESKK